MILTNYNSGLGNRSPTQPGRMLLNYLTGRKQEMVKRNLVWMLPLSVLRLNTNRTQKPENQFAQYNKPSQVYTYTSEEYAKYLEGRKLFLLET